MPDGQKNGLLMFWLDSWLRSLLRRGDAIVLNKRTAQTWRW